MRTAEGKLYLLVAIDRTSKFAVVELLERADSRAAAAFLEALIESVPYRIRTLLTDNGIRSPTLPKNRPADRPPPRPTLRPALPSLRRRASPAKPNHPRSTDRLTHENHQGGHRQAQHGRCSSTVVLAGGKPRLLSKSGNVYLQSPDSRCASSGRTHETGRTCRWRMARSTGRRPARMLSWLPWPTSSHGRPGRSSQTVTTTGQKRYQHRQCGKMPPTSKRCALPLSHASTMRALPRSLHSKARTKGQP